MALFERTHGAVVGGVEDRLEIEPADEQPTDHLVGRSRPQPAADLGRQRETVAQHIADAVLQQAAAVERRRIEVADAMQTVDINGELRDRLRAEF